MTTQQIIEILQNIIKQIDKDQANIIGNYSKGYLEGRKDAFTFIIELLQEVKQNDRHPL